MILPNSDLNKQAREKMMEQCSDLLVISLRATAKHLRIAYSNLESDADNIIKGVDRIESLSTQVARLKLVLESTQLELDGEQLAAASMNGVLTDLGLEKNDCDQWYNKRAEAAEAQVAELKQDAERLLNDLSKLHDGMHVIDSIAFDQIIRAAKESGP